MKQRDKDEIREIVREVVREELRAALHREIDVVKAGRQQGEPESVTVRESWNVLDFLAYYLPHLEGALRGVQEDVDRAKNDVAGNTAKLQAVGDTLVSLHGSARQIVALSESMRTMLDNPGRIVREALIQSGERELREAIADGADHRP
jgi:hypothetical protein